MGELKIVTPLLTIFKDDCTIDIEGNKKLINNLIDNGVDGVVTLGSTGEFTLINFEEKKKLIKTTIETVNKRGVVFVGTSCQRIEETIELSNYSFEKGANGVLLICQYYYAMNDEEIFNYYDIIAPKINGDIYLYNFPDRTNTSFTPKLVLDLLRRHKNIVGMKESVQGFAHTRDIMREVKKEFPNFKMYSGFDDQFLDNIDYGGAGSIGALSNLFPKLWSSWIISKKENNIEEVLKIKLKIMDLMELYQIESNCQGLFKEILKERGLDINTKTLFPFEEVKKENIDKALELISKVL